jgi:thioredoxin reductase (NADPH)
MTDTDSTDPGRRRLVIAGTGISGLTAAIYAARAGNDPLVLEGREPGGQLTLTTDVANYPGFPEGISGPDLVDRMKEQAEQFGAEIRHGVAERIEPGESRGAPHRVTLSNGDRIATDAFVAASGASARTLEIPGEDDLMGYGVSTCATCDGAFFRDQELAVIGGGDAAMEEAHFLTKFASTVHLIHRREEFRAEAYWIDEIERKVESGEVEIRRNTELTEIHGSPEEGISHTTLVTNPEGHPTDRLDDDRTEKFDFDVDGVFIAIGHTPNTGYFEGTDIETDDVGYVYTKGGRDGGQTETGVPGIFAAGDVVDHHYQQAITAGGMGCQAAMDADAYLDAIEREPEAEPAATASGD